MSSRHSYCTFVFVDLIKAHEGHDLVLEAPWILDAWLYPVDMALGWDVLYLVDRTDGVTQLL
jgi:hypothetical protein